MSKQTTSTYESSSSSSSSSLGAFNFPGRPRLGEDYSHLPSVARGAGYAAVRYQRQQQDAVQVEVFFQPHDRPLIELIFDDNDSDGNGACSIPHRPREPAHHGVGASPAPPPRSVRPRTFRFFHCCGSAMDVVRKRRH